MGYYKKIVGSRIYLSPIDTGDYEIFTEWLNDLETSLYLAAGSQIRTAEIEKEKLEKMTREDHHFAVVDLEKDELLGTSGLFKADHINRSAELGIFIGNKKYQEKGYGPETIKLVLDYGFNLLNLHSIYLFTYSFNRRAIRCYERCGFKHAGRLRDAYLLGGKKYDSLLMDILCDEFEGSIGHGLDN